MENNNLNLRTFANPVLENDEVVNLIKEAIQILEWKINYEEENPEGENLFGINLIQLQINRLNKILEPTISDKDL